MIEIHVKSDSRTEDDLRETADRFRDLSGANRRVAEELARANERVNFDPQHAASILRVDNGAGAIGSKAEKYAELLEIPDEEIADILAEYALEGTS